MYTACLMRLATATILLASALPAQLLQSYRADAAWEPAADPATPHWRGIEGVRTTTDRYGKLVPGAETVVRSRWTDSHLYFLFTSHFNDLHLKSNPTKEETWGLWDYDVVEVFIGWQLERIGLYKEFEISPQGEFVDLDVDYFKASKQYTVDWKWNGGIEYKTRIDRDAKIWYCEVRIPWKSIDERTPKVDNELRLNLYRIEGPPPNRKYISWRPVYGPSFHTPQAFGRLRLMGAPTTPTKKYDLLLKGGTVIDPRMPRTGPNDVAIFGGVVAAVAPSIDPSLARKVVDLKGLYVTPGLIDLHVHVANGSGLLGSLPIDQNVYADSHTLRSGVTTVVDAGTSGWRSFPDFKRQAIDVAVTRILASLNIVGAGQAGPEPEQNVEDMDPEAAAKMVEQYRGTIVGIKTAHYRGPEWVAVDRALAAGRRVGVPIMVDFGLFHPARPFPEMLKRLGPGDMYTHTYVAAVPMLDDQGRVLPYLFEQQRRGVRFDAGHGGGSFAFRQAAPAIAQGFLPNTISTDLHTGSMNGPMNNMLNVMSKFLNLGMKLEDVVVRATSNPAANISRTDLGRLEAGALADIAVLRVEEGDFGFVDVLGARMAGKRRLSCEMTIREGKVVFDLNGRTRADFRTLGQYGTQADPIWDRILSAPR